MLRQVRAATPRLMNLALRSKQAAVFVEAASTTFQKKAHVIELDGVNNQLVTEAIKLGSSVMNSLKQNQSKKELEDKEKRLGAAALEKTLEDKDKRLRDAALEKTNALSIPKALGIGASIAAVPALAANYTINKASDDLDTKMWAIPGIAAATVGAILAARSGGSPTAIPEEEAEELEKALHAKQVLDSAVESTTDGEISEELAKMSSISTDHIASLLVDLLT